MTPKQYIEVYYIIFILIWWDILIWNIYLFAILDIRGYAWCVTTGVTQIKTTNMVSISDFNTDLKGFKNILYSDRYLGEALNDLSPLWRPKHC